MGERTQPPQISLRRTRSSARRFTHTALVAAIGHALAAGLATAPAWPVAALAADVASAAVPSRKAYDIPAGSLEATLNRFGREAGILLSFPTEVTAGLQSKGLRGNYAVQEALPLLLQGTGLAAMAQSNGSYVLVKRAEPAPPEATADEVMLPTVRVKAAFEKEMATGPVTGYVAKRSATGSKTDTPIVETPQSISVITSDEIRALGATTLREALGYSTGVQVEQSMDLRDEWFQLRGFDAQENVYRDGLRVGVSAGGYANADVNPYGLERIEVLRGPSSVLYGKASPGGVVNLTSKRPTDTPLHEIELLAGSFKHKQAAFDLSDALGGEWSYRLTGLLKDSETQTDFANDDRIYIAPALMWKPSANTSLTLLANYQRNKQGAAINMSLPRIGTLTNNVNGKIPVERYHGEPGFDRFKKTQSSLGYLFDHRFDEMWSFRQNLRYSDVGVDYANAYGDSLGADQRTLGRKAFTPRESARSWRVDNQLQAQWMHGVFEHTALFGLDYQRTRYGLKAGFGDAPDIDIYNPSYGAPVAEPALYENSVTRSSQIGLYLQDQIKYDKRWVFLLGGRLDNTRSEKHESIGKTNAAQRDFKPTGRTGVVYLFDSGLAPYASYSTSFDPVIGVKSSGNTFMPTEGKQAEIGVRYQPSGSRSMVSAALFDLTQKNVRTIDPNNPTNSIQTGEVRSRGLELEAKWGLTSALNLIASYTYLDAKVTQSNDGTKGNQRARTSKNSASLWADYTVQTGDFRGLSMGIGARYKDSMPIADTNIYRIPARTLVDAMLRYDWKQYTASLNVTNLLNKEYVGVCYSDDYGFCGYGPVRNISVSLRYRW